MSEFKTLLMGDMSIALFIFNSIMLIVGYAIFHTLYVRRGVKSRYNNTATKFDFWYWVQDNGRDVFLFNLIGYAIVRFTGDFMKISGWDKYFSEYIGGSFLYLVLGFGYQKIVELLRKQKYADGAKP